jgi:hypothetical protein
MPWPKRDASAIWPLIILILGTWVATGCRSAKQIAPTVEASPVSPLTIALQEVEEDRGEPVGRLAKILVPAELRHYPDRRRFLAIQRAEWLKHQTPVPRDFAELAAQILRAELVEIPSPGDGYVLYGVGEQATSDYFSHYDIEIKKDIPLYSDLEEFRAELDRLKDVSLQLTEQTKELERALKYANRRDRKSRTSLLKQLSSTKKQRKDVEEERELIVGHYSDPRKLAIVRSALRPIAQLASNFGGTNYDLAKPEQRRLMRVRMLSFIRPAARDILLEIARAYQSSFDRPLPITSLVRSGDYQRHLYLTNRNASTSSIPPHTTGLAFDVYTYFMSAAEQDFLMSTIARLEAEGRVEALREQRDHIHVFAFIDGTRPDESLIKPTRSSHRSRR